MFVLKDLVVDMTNFYTQYRSIVPYLQRKTPKKEGVNLIIFRKSNFTKVLMIEKNLMDSMSVSFALAALLPVPPTGGILMSI